MRSRLYAILSIPVFGILYLVTAVGVIIYKGFIYLFRASELSGHFIKKGFRLLLKVIKSCDTITDRRISKGGMVLW